MTALSEITAGVAIIIGLILFIPVYIVLMIAGLIYQLLRKI